MTDGRREGDAPLTATIIGPLDTLPPDTIAQTPDHLPNVTLKMVQPVAAIAIRFVNAYLTVFVGLVAGAGVTGAIPASDFLHMAYKCAGLALAGPVIGSIKDIITIFTGLEKKFPLQTGNV